MIKKIKIITLILLALYWTICLVLFIFQEKLIFFPQKLEKEHQFIFEQPFEEVNIKSFDGIALNGLLFKADTAQGLVFYLHGNAGSLDSWGEVAKTYTDLNYDVFILDYRGYGKSGGKIKNQEQLYKDIQLVYDTLKEKYPEDKTIVLGYSIGTGLASKVASDNSPKLLILQAPYYSLSDLMKHIFPVVPNFILKFKFRTDQFLGKCKIPVFIFHGDKDEVIYYGSSLKLKKLYPDLITLITLPGQGHNGITNNRKYLLELQKLLER
jgi:uncharacterized protein